MNSPMTLLMAQFNPLVGAIDNNIDKIIDIINQYQPQHDLIVFPELAITGYPPEDLLLRPAFHTRIQQGLERIKREVLDCHVIVGHPHVEKGHCFNAASIFYQGQRIALYFKQQLPNDSVFDEKRYFTPGEANPCLFKIKDRCFGLIICEDLWQEGPVNQVLAANAEGLICINASPFDAKKQVYRENLARNYAIQGLSIIYVNLSGGQDELVFDGQSFVMDKTGTICARSPAFRDAFQTVILHSSKIQGKIAEPHTEEQLIYEALVCGTQDYVKKNGFQGVLIGLSGGIDSALTLAIAVDALGPSQVHAVLMPSRYTAAISGEDAYQQVRDMQVKHSTLSIEPIFQAFLDTLAPEFANLPSDITEENLQARIRGSLLMALSNKTGKLVLTTSNKSETAVGYSTLYGDMAGGFAVLKDVLKTQVYTLAHYRNQQSPVIPERVILRPPSAELAANQTDQDSLPAYPILDAIIQAYVEQNLSAEDIINAGYNPLDVEKIIALIKRSEYKRRQAAPGIKITTRAFGRDWRYPITCGF